MAKGDWFYNEDLGDMDREDEEPGCGTILTALVILLIIVLIIIANK